MSHILNVEDDLAAIFGNYRDSAWDSEWKHLQEKKPVGSRVTGKIALIYPFGCFLDIGERFPALLLITNIDSRISLVPEEYARAIKVGQELTGKIYIHVDDRRQIGVTQKS